MVQEEYVILVNEQDEAIGVEEKLRAHQLALLHRAFSVFIFRDRSKQEILLHRRHPSKYHCGNLWTNTCCSHPRPSETIMEAAQRRLSEEMGMKAGLQTKGIFHYTAHFDNGLIENEIDHVLIGFSNPDVIHPNPTEVSEYRWESVTQINNELKNAPHSFTPWFSKALSVAVE